MPQVKLAECGALGSGRLPMTAGAPVAALFAAAPLAVQDTGISGFAADPSAGTTRSIANASGVILWKNAATRSDEEE